MVENIEGIKEYFYSKGYRLHPFTPSLWSDEILANFFCSIFSEDKNGYTDIVYIQSTDQDGQKKFRLHQNRLLGVIKELCNTNHIAIIENCDLLHKLNLEPRRD